MDKKKLFEQAWICDQMHKEKNSGAFYRFACERCPNKTECFSKRGTPWTKIDKLGFYSEYKDWLRKKPLRDLREMEAKAHGIN